MRRIVLVGSSGAGKTTLACKLSEILHIQAIHLDQYCWQEDIGRKWPKDVWQDFQKYLVQNKEWIIDGTYLSTSEIRFFEADTIIFLDMPNWLCLWQIIKRHNQYAGKEHPPYFPIYQDTLDPVYLLKVFLKFPLYDRLFLLKRIQNARAKEFSFLKTLRRLVKFGILFNPLNPLSMVFSTRTHTKYSYHDNTGKKQFIWLRSPKEVNDFLFNLKTSPVHQTLETSQPAIETMQEGVEANSCSTS